MDRGRFDGSKGEPFQRTMPSSPPSPPRCTYTHRLIPGWPGVVRPVRYGYRGEIRRGLTHHAMDISVSS